MSSLDRYRNMHLWMLLPFLIVFLGFSRSYFFNLGNASWPQHLHGVSATLWYVLLIVQPYLITRKKDYVSHKKLGLIGILIAGLVAGTAFNIIPGNLANVDKYTEADFFSPNFAYTATLLDLLMVTGFVICVGIATIKAKNLYQHTGWLLASAFIIIGAASTRLYAIVSFMFTTDVTFKIAAVPAMTISLLIASFYFYKFSSFKHPAYYVLLIANLPAFFVDAVGSNDTWRQMADAIFK